jgi:ArsR family transcriptional regulator, arsenate/arsenite/antimonite-responsive transcriptional repressor
VREETFIQIAKALADPTRHAIVREVRKAGELTCTQVCERFEQSQPTISHHIKTLDAAGVLKVNKDGPFHRLTVDADVLDEFARSVSGEAPVAAKKRKG